MLYFVVILAAVGYPSRGAVVGLRVERELIKGLLKLMLVVFFWLFCAGLRHHRQKWGFGSILVPMVAFRDRCFQWVAYMNFRGFLIGPFRAGGLAGGRVDYV